MTDENTQDINTEGFAEMSEELTLLKQRARLMGLQFSNNIGLQALRQKIEERQAKTDEAEIPEVEINPLAGTDSDATPIGRKKTLREVLLESEMKLIRIRVTCMDPKKSDLPGEIFTVANEYIGTVRKFVPFGEVSDEGYHVPHCIYEMMKNRKFLNIRTVKQQNGRIKIEQKMAQEFALEVLTPLTVDELKRLATSQAAAGINSSDD